MKNMKKIVTIMLLFAVIITGGIINKPQAVMASQKSDALKAYRDFLSENKWDEGELGTVHGKYFGLKDLNGDKIPELIINQSNNKDGNRCYAIFSYYAKDICLDDDGQTPANEVGKLLNKINEGYDVVYASYDNKRQAGWRNLGSWVNSKMTEVMLGKPPELVVNSYFAARRFIVDEMLRYEHCYPYVIGLVLRSTKRIANVSVHHRAREEGRSGYTISKLLNLWMNGFTSFSVKPLRLATYAGTVFAGFGFLYLIYIIIDHFVRGAAPMGWASTTALLLLLGGMILLVLGLIGEYVGRIYMCANAAPQYVAREYIKHE